MNVKLKKKKIMYNKEDLTLSQVKNLGENIIEIMSNEATDSRTMTVALIALGYLNASAYKGYRDLEDLETESYNSVVYDYKTRAIELAVKRVKEEFSEDIELGSSEDRNVIYFTFENSLQISFHIMFMEGLDDVLDTLPVIEWCRVLRSYRYFEDIDKYEKIKRLSSYDLDFEDLVYLDEMGNKLPDFIENMIAA